MKTILVFILLGIGIILPPCLAQEVKTDTVGNISVTVEKFEQNYSYTVAIVNEEEIPFIGTGTKDKDTAQVDPRWYYDYQESLRKKAWETAIGEKSSRDFRNIIYSVLSQQEKKKFHNVNGYMLLKLRKDGHVVEYTLGLKFGEKQPFILTTKQCVRLFKTLDNSIFNPWDENVDYLSATIGLAARNSSRPESVDAGTALDKDRHKTTNRKNENHQ